MSFELRFLETQRFDSVYCGSAAGFFSLNTLCTYAFLETSLRQEGLMNQNIQMCCDVCKSTHDTFRKPTAHCQTLFHITFAGNIPDTFFALCLLFLSTTSLIFCHADGCNCQIVLCCTALMCGESERSGWERPAVEVGRVRSVQSSHPSGPSQ